VADREAFRKEIPRDHSNTQEPQ
jgi:hypothetical protein